MYECVLGLAGMKDVMKMFENLWQEILKRISSPLVTIKIDSNSNNVENWGKKERGKGEVARAQDCKRLVSFVDQRALVWLHSQYIVLKQFQ